LDCHKDAYLLQEASIPCQFGKPAFILSGAAMSGGVLTIAINLPPWGYSAVAKMAMP
jgi:hypothetical protein